MARMVRVTGERFGSDITGVIVEKFYEKGYNIKR